MGYIIRDGVIYGGGGSGGGDNIFHGTQAEWEQLSSAQKASYDFAAFTDDYDPSSISNPNLLDNPWFTVNQREKGDNWTSGYGVDRWLTVRLNSVVNADGSISGTRTSTTQICYFMQRLPKGTLKNLVGRTVTLSALLSDNSIVKATHTLFDGWNSINVGNYMFGIDTTANTEYDIFDFGLNPNSSIETFTVKAVKLELGSQSTLAMDTAPNYATELLKCQRYFVRLKPNIGNTNVGIGFACTTADLRVPISLPCEMRTTPTLTKSGASHYKYTKTIASDAVSASDVLLSSINGTDATIRLIGTYNVSETYLVYVSTTSAYIDLSADL